MNTDKLVPLDFSRKITPFVLDDKLFNTRTGNPFIIDCPLQLAAFNTFDNTDEGVYFVVSYADRPNTGKQPVDDDVTLDVYYKGKWHARRAGHCAWGIDGDSSDISKWKPNHYAALNRYQASIADKEDERMNNIARNGNDGDHYDVNPELSAIEALERFGYKYVDGVWSQQEVKPDDDAKAYNEAAGNSAQTTLEGLGYEWLGGEQWKPPIGKVPSFISDDPSLAAYMNPHVKDSSIERLGVFLRKNELVVEGEGVIDCVIRELAEKHDIDIRTNEEKLRDAMVDVIGRPDSLDSLGFLEDDLNKLIASPLITITYKGK